MCDGGNTAPTLDEYDNLTAAGSWTTLDAGSLADGGDITTVLQNAVNQVVGASTSTVVYIPPGSYLISQPIVVTNASGITITGDDPDTTVITWDGGIPSGGASMFEFINANDSKLARITLSGLGTNPVFDGGSSQPALGGVAVTQVGTATLATYYDEFDDDVFTNLSFGIVMVGAQTGAGVGLVQESDGPSFQSWTNTNYALGVSGTGQNTANIQIRRSSFESISRSGVSINGQNTLDIIVEDNAFINCHQGVSVGYSTSANLINNLFYNNDSADDDSVSISGFTQGSSNVYRGNVSIGANTFYAGFGGVDDFSGNYVVLNPQTPHCLGVFSQEPGMLFLDNYIDGPTDGGCVEDPWNGGEYAAVGILSGGLTHGHNAYSGPATAFAVVPTNGSGRALQERCVGGDAGCPTAGDTADSFPPSLTIPAAAAAAFAGWGSPTLSGPPPRPTIAPSVTTRNVINVKTITACNSATSSGCAAAISSAIAGAGAHPMLYFPPGSYYIDAQINIPASLDIVIAGDGSQSVLLWVGSAGDAGITANAGVLDAYFFHAQSPSSATFRNLQLQSNKYVVSAKVTQPGGILVDSADDVGGLVYIDKSGAGSGHTVRTGLALAGLDNVLVRAEQYGAGGEVGVDVIGGGRAGPTPDGGSSETQGIVLLGPNVNALSNAVAVRNWGKAIFAGIDLEDGAQGMALNQSGYLTIDTGRFFTTPLPGNLHGLFPLQPNLVVQGTFRGNVTFANLSTSAGVYSVGAPEAQVLSLNNYSGGAGMNEGVAVPSCPLLDGGPSPPFRVTTTPCNVVTEADGGLPQMGVVNQVEECYYDAGADGAPDGWYGTGLVNGGNPGFAFCTDSTNTTAVAENTFLDTMLTDMRHVANAAPICGTACGQTAVRIHNVWFAGVNGNGSVSGWMRTGIRVQRN